MKKKRIIRISIIAFVVLVIILSIAKKKGWIGNDNGIKVATEMVKKRSIIETVSANGRIQPEAEVKISPDISGEIIELFVKEGDEVKKGDILAKVNPEIYQSNFEQIVATLNAQKANHSNAKARLEQVKAQFINAKSTYNRNKLLYDQKVISDADFDAVKSSYEVSKAEVNAAEESVNAAEYAVQNAQAAVKEARENLSKTTIFAPNNGTIYNLIVEKGERVVGASQFSSGTEIMRIANLNRMEVSVEVNENDIVRVKYGDTALIDVDAYLNRKFKGIVTEIANSANVTGISADQVTNFDVKIRMLQESYADLVTEDKPNISPFRPGMSATVEIQTESAVDILTIPIQAVTTREDSTGRSRSSVEKEETEEDDIAVADEKKEREEVQEYVFLYENGKAKMQKVKSGIQDNNYIQILEGLDEGQEVITAPYRAITKKLKNNDEVIKVDKKDLFTEEN